MFKSLNKIIDNELTETDLDFYSVIIGAKPSRGARSPKLWNKVYEYEGKRVKMVPLDVGEDKLEQLFNYLRQDPYCLGGAVAVPYKEKVFNFIKNNVKKEIKTIGAVNCFFRPTTGTSSDEFTGTNTDGEAALEPIRKQLEESENLTIGLLGFGGAGKAILAFLLKDYKDKHHIYLFNRTPVNLKNKEKIELNSYSLTDLDTYISNLDLLINATSVGHIDNIHMTPLSTELLAKAKKTIVIYDIIYDPIKTALLKISERRGLSTINGLRMNLVQAVLAYNYTNSTNLTKEEIFKIMN